MSDEKVYKTDHAAMAFIKDNIFPLMALIFGLIGLYSLTQTLPLKSEIELNKQAILGVSKTVDVVRAEAARKDVVEVQLSEINKKVDSISSKNDIIIGQHSEFMNLLRSNLNKE